MSRISPELGKRIVLAVAPVAFNGLISGKVGEAFTRQTLYWNYNVAIGLALLTLTESAILFYAGYWRAGRRHQAEKAALISKANSVINQVASQANEKVNEVLENSRNTILQLRERELRDRSRLIDHYETKIKAK